MLSAYQRPIATKPTVHFLEALATNEASATVNLQLPTRDAMWFVRAISIISVQNLAWELQTFTRAVNGGPTLETDYFNAAWQFGTLVVGPPASPGWPFDAVDATPPNDFYHYYVDGNMQPYLDLDAMTTPNPAANVPLGQGVANATGNNAALHVRLINRSAASKTAGAGGALLVTFFMALQGRQA